MKAVVITRPGGPEVLEIRELPDPTFGPEEVRARVRATAVNRADLLQRRGRYPAPPGASPDVPGLEFTGEVEACGERVGLVGPGDRIMGLLGGGGYAEKVVLHERMCVGVPAAMGWDQAAAVPEAFMTAFDALFERGRLASGETVLLNAAGSGVGTAVLQLAAVSGASVIALSRSAEKRRRLAALGADCVVDPGGGSARDEILSAAAGGVDLIVDLLGAASWSLNLEVLAPRGRIVLVGTLTGRRVEVDLSALMRKRAVVIGTVLRSRPLEEKISLSRKFARRVLPLLAAGRIASVVDRVLPLEEAAVAHAAMEGNENFGKIVLRVGGARP